MEQVVSPAVVIPESRWSRVTSRARLELPTLAEWGLAAVSTSLLILSFPDYETSVLAWIALVPLLLAIARRPAPGFALIVGWSFGAVFFYVTCHWLTYSMIHYGGLPTLVAYLLLIPGALVIGIFPGLFAVLMALVIRRWGTRALLFAPIFWAALEWARLGVTGQLWNAIGYSQAFNPLLIQPARWGGVYAVSFLILTINAVIAIFILKRMRSGFVVTLVIPVAVVVVLIAPFWFGFVNPGNTEPAIQVVALQPNVPMTLHKTAAEQSALLDRHWDTSRTVIQTLQPARPRLVIWPESPMNFTYGTDKSFQEVVAAFAKENQTSLLFNSLEPAPDGGAYNSALLINEEGRLISQYDKIRLMPFGEYVPLPQWLPGASLISGIVGDFTPGARYTLMPVDGRRLGTFICIESAYPWIARNLVREGADGLINISNDGYLGPTAVMRQHLANAVFRAVENNTPLLRVTNTGISANIGPNGIIYDQTGAFQPDVRAWMLFRKQAGSTFYTRFGDLFVEACFVVTLIVMAVLFVSWRRSITHRR